MNAYAVSVSSIRLTWQDNAANETAYVLQRSTTEGSGYASNDTSGSAAVNAPLVQLYGAQIGSSRGAAGYHESARAMPQTYSFKPSANPMYVGAASFIPLVQTPGTVIIIH